MSLTALLFVVSLESSRSVPAYRQEAPKPIFIKDVRIVVKPGTVIAKGSLLLENGKIAKVGANLSAPANAEIVDGAGLTAYPGFVNPYMAIMIEGAGRRTGGQQGAGRATQTAEQQAEAQRKRDADPFGKESNLFSKVLVKDLKDVELPGLKSLGESGYGLAHVSSADGVVGAVAAILSTASGTASSSHVRGETGMIPLRFARSGFGGGGGGGYPGSQMGTTALLRQTLMDATYKRPAGDANPTLDNLKPVAIGENRAVFDDLNEVSFHQATKIIDEFRLRPILGFRQDAGALASTLKTVRGNILLKGNIPIKPTLGANLQTANLLSVRSYFNEVQAAAELERAKIEWSYAPSSSADPLSGIRMYVRGGLSRDAALAAMTVRPAKVIGMADKAGTIEANRLGNVVLVQGDLFDSSSQIMASYVDGKRVTGEMPLRKKDELLTKEEPLKLAKPLYGRFPAPAETKVADRLYRNATIWTQGPQGTLTNADVLIQGGKIKAIGRNLRAPNGCQVIDATGKHISPGIWDCHSHTGISGGVNEGSNMITAECRIGDVIDHTSNSIYVQLSGGTVGANQLHGSANVIGGQNSTVKWRWGQPSSAFPVESAPPGVKFALGQNPIREDSGGFGQQSPPEGGTLLTWRPRTRMGVEESLRRALQLGKEYNQAWADFRSGKSQVEPKRDIQLEALGEIVAGKRVIHSHGYRADEMLMLIRVAKAYGAKINTLQHVLEGYKIADEMAEAGVGGSTFADWWGYKLEAYDAIPYNAALMANRGVSVSVNSDSDNHARRLNQEAAKSMRYGGVSAEEALSYVTIEPAKQLGIADRTGSLEVGKDADLAIWTDSPLSVYAICVETYVDGVKRFDRLNDAKQRADRIKELEEARKLLSEPSDGKNPFTDGSGTAANAKVEANTSGIPAKAKYGLGPVTGQPATKRYPRSAFLIRQAMIHPMVGAPFVGDVLVAKDGKIENVAPMLKGNGAQEISGVGKHVYPGLIDPATGIGLNEIGQVPTSDDSSERGNFHPDYRVERAINPEWDTLGVARQQGILTVLVKPSGGGIPGQAALINTEGFTYEDLTIQGGIALAYSLGGGGGFGGLEHDDSVNHDNCCGVGTDEHTSGQGRQGGGGGVATTLESLSTQLNDAREYAKKRDAATAEKPVPADQRQEAMLKVASGELPVIISATSATDMKAAVAWSEKEGVRILLYGCSGAGEIVDWLAQNQVPICLAAVYSMPRSDQEVDYFYSLPARLAKAGVKFCLTTNNDKDVRQLRDQAGWAAAYGLDREDAARMITLWAAQVMGIDDRLGAIMPGLEGTIILTDGEITETKTQVLRAWIQGREVDLTNRQTRLYDKYRNRPKPH